MAKFLLLTILLINSLFSNETYLKNENSTQNFSTKENDETNIDELENEVIVDGLKSTLRKSVDYAVAKLGSKKGYLNSEARINLPKELKEVERLIRDMGGNQIADNFIYSLNNTASKTIPKISPIFNKAIDEIDENDAKNILSSQEDSATSYFRNKTYDSLKTTIKPIIRENLKQNQISPLYQNTQFDFEEFLTQGTIDGLFMFMAVKEAELKANPQEDMEKKIKRIFKN